MEIQGVKYEIIEVYNNSITLPDSFSVQANKFGKGHGEAKLYVGTKIQMNNFFVENAECFVLKKDFEYYRSSLESAKAALNSIYKKSISKNKNFNKILKGIDDLILKMNSKEVFKIKLMNNLKGSRGYINTTNAAITNGYYYLRGCCIPFVSFIRVLKLKEISTNRIYFYIKLFPNYDEMYRQVQSIRNYGKRNVTDPNRRSGQTKYKRELFQLFSECPFTHINDERLLIASHIKPFAACSKKQQYDTENGLLLSPLYDKLFDRGFITFNQKGEIKKTIWLSPNEWQKIPLNYETNDLKLTPARKAYLRFHEEQVFLGD